MSVVNFATDLVPAVGRSRRINIDFKILTQLVSENHYKHVN